MTTPAFLQQKPGSVSAPPTGGPPGGVPNLLKGRTVVPVPQLPPMPGPPRPNNVRPNTSNTGTGNNNVRPNTY